MKRDGALESIWQHSIPDYIQKAQAFTNKEYDVVIAGGGITGITTALQLQKAGKRCLVLEAKTLCFGTTGGTTAHLNSFFDTSYSAITSKFGEAGAQLSCKMAEQALELFRSNVETYQIDCTYAQKDGYLYATEDEQVKELDEIFTASKNAGADVSYTDRIPVPVPFKKAIVYHAQAQIHPAQYVYALARAFEDAGGIIVQNCSVETVHKNEALLEVVTAQGNVQANHVIYATHIPPGLNLMHFRNAPYRSYAMAFSLKDNAYPDALAYDMYDPYHYFRTQEIEGKTYLIVGGEDHKTAHEKNTDASFHKLEAYVKKFYEVDEVAFKWSSQYFEPADGLAYIGHLPENPDQVLVATGFGGNGMTYSHISALVLTGLIVNGQHEASDLYRPNRIKPVAGFANFVKENADVVKEFIGKRLDVASIKEMADLAPGEARIVKYEGKKLGLYKDEAGSIHAINPVCTHAKCLVDWNTSEKSWDCPCHGARYTPDGEVITGPAQHALEVVSLKDLVERSI